MSRREEALEVAGESAEAREASVALGALTTKLQSFMSQQAKQEDDTDDVDAKGDVCVDAPTPDAKGAAAEAPSTKELSQMKNNIADLLAKFESAAAKAEE